MPMIRKLKVVRAVVKPAQRDEYLGHWSKYAELASAAGAQVRLLEDQALPGRFLEVTEHVAAEGMESALDAAVRDAELRRLCVRRDGDDLLYREVRPAG